MKTIIKIDLCESKKFFDKHKLNNPNIRKEVLDTLIEKVSEIFPYATNSYPEGSLYSGQGDCIHIILDKPTVALRHTIEFMKQWYGLISNLPDCRAVIDLGTITQSEIGERNERIELHSEAFENISVLEKQITKGKIGITDIVISKCDNTLVQFINTRNVTITKSRSVKLSIANYENPRIIEDSALVHALFITNPSGTKVRERTFELLIIESVCEKISKKISINELQKWLKNKNCSFPGKEYIEKIIKYSKYLYLKDNYIELEDKTNDVMNDVKIGFEQSRLQTIQSVSKDLSKILGIEEAIIIEKINIEKLIESYLCSIFLEIRLIANYYKSTETFFERLVISNEYDYILHDYLKPILKDKVEEFKYLKKAFLKSLQQALNKDNIFIASIFHNVLMLYYLNKNPRFSHIQLSQFRKKKLYLDTNTFYALMCKASEFNEILRFLFEKILSLGAEIIIFDKSLIEYNDSLKYTYHRYHMDRGLSFYSRINSPWIWKEYQKNPNAYNNDFEYCIATHRLPKDYNVETFFEDAEQELSQLQIKLEKFHNYKTKEELGELFKTVFNVKLSHNSLQTNQEAKSYEKKVIHDANCILALKCTGSNPFISENIFVTCDYGLAKIRKKVPNKYEYIVTISEFNEFILPYLLLSDAMTSNPIEMPNFLLASALSLNLKSLDFNELVGDFLAGQNEINKDYKILSKMSNDKRFKEIKNKFNKLNKSDEKDESEIESYIKDVASISVEYTKEVKESLQETFYKDKLDEKTDEIEELENKNIKLQKQIDRLVDKKRKKIKYRKRYNKKHN